MADLRITTWDELVAHLRGRALRELATGVIDIALADPYAQPELRLRVTRALVHDAPWVDLVALVGNARTLPITNSLTNNGVSVVGAFCFVDGQVALRQLLPLEGLRVADLERAIKVLAWRVVEAKRQLTS